MVVYYVPETLYGIVSWIVDLPVATMLFLWLRRWLFVVADGAG